MPPQAIQLCEWPHYTPLKPSYNSLHSQRKMVHTHELSEGVWYSL